MRLTTPTTKGFLSGLAASTLAAAALAVGITLWAAPAEACAQCHGPTSTAPQITAASFETPEMVRMAAAHDSVLTEIALDAGTAEAACSTCHAGNVTPVLALLETPEQPALLQTRMTDPDIAMSSFLKDPADRHHSHPASAASDCSSCHAGQVEQPVLAAANACQTCHVSGTSGDRPLLAMGGWVTPDDLRVMRH